MTGNKKEQKKKPCNLSGAGLKESSVKKKTNTLKVSIISSNMITSHPSGTSEVFWFCFLKFTFHFYTYKATKCFETAYF